MRLSEVERAPWPAALLPVAIASETYYTYIPDLVRRVPDDFDQDLLKFLLVDLLTLHQEMRGLAGYLVFTGDRVAPIRQRTMKEAMISLTLTAFHPESVEYRNPHFVLTYKDYALADRNNVWGELGAAVDTRLEAMRLESGELKKTEFNTNVNWYATRRFENLLGQYLKELGGSDDRGTVAQRCAIASFQKELKRDCPLLSDDVGFAVFQNKVAHADATVAGILLPSGVGFAATDMREFHDLAVSQVEFIAASFLDGVAAVAVRVKGISEIDKLDVHLQAVASRLKQQARFTQCTNAFPLTDAEVKASKERRP